MEILKGFVFDLQKFAVADLSGIAQIKTYIKQGEQLPTKLEDSSTTYDLYAKTSDGSLLLTGNDVAAGDDYTKIGTVTSANGGSVAGADIVYTLATQTAVTIYTATLTNETVCDATVVLTTEAAGTNTFSGATKVGLTGGAFSGTADTIKVLTGTVKTKTAAAADLTAETATGITYVTETTGLSTAKTVTLPDEQTVKVKDEATTTYDISVGRDGVCTALGTTTEFAFNKGEGTVNTVKYVDDSAADGFTVTSTATSSYLSDGTVALDGTKDNKAVTVKVNGDEKAVSLSAGTAVVAADGKVTEATAGSNITTTVAADGGVATVKEFAVGATITVNKVPYVAGKAVAGDKMMPLTITTTAESSSLQNGTVYLKDSGSVEAGGVTVTFKTGDISVTVADGAITTVHDLDNGDSFTVTKDTTTKTYTVVNGVLKDETGTKVGEAKLVSGDEGVNSLDATIATGAVTATAKVANVYEGGGEGKITNEMDISIKVRKGLEGDMKTVSSVFEKGNTYVYADGTVGTDSKNAIGQISYNSSKEVYIYDSKTESSTIDISGDGTHKWIVTGGSGKDNIKGNAAESTLKGGSGNDTIEALAGNLAKGDAGNDVLTTAAAKDVTLDGGAGDDKLWATTNANAQVTLTGGAGVDTFVLNDKVDEVATAGYGFISDYKLAEDVILDTNNTKAQVQTLVDTSAKTANDNYVNVNGAFGDGNGMVTLGASDGFYAVNVKTSDGKQIIGWTGENSTKIDASSFKDGVMLVGTKNDATDSLYGGSGDDSIYAGAGDVIFGAAGKNTLVLDGVSTDDLGVTVGVGKGKDTITKFVGGFDSEKSDKLTIVGGLSSIGSTLDGGTLNLKSGDASVVMTGANTFGNTVEVLVNGKKAVFAEAGATVKADSATYADYYLGTKDSNGNTSILDASAIEESVSIDLSNANVFRNFNQVTGGKGKTTLIGTSGNDTITAGEGMTSLYGGAGKDSLVATNADSRDTFFMMAGAGSDSISGFTYFNGENADAADVVNLSAVQSAKLVSGGVQINVNDTDKVVVENAGADDAIGYQIGNSIAAAKIGSVSGANSFTYLKGVNYYGGGNQTDTLTFTSGDADNHEIWLDGSKGVSYASIDVVDGSNTSGNLILAGDSAKNTIVGGAGTNSLWGGAGNAADTLTGGNSQNTFFYGLAEGNDVIDCGSDNDLVNLYNIGLSDVSKAEITSSAVNLEFIDGSKLTVNTGYRDVKFAMKDGSTYTADHNSNSWK